MAGASQHGIRSAQIGILANTLLAITKLVAGAREGRVPGRRAGRAERAVHMQLFEGAAGVRS